MSTANEPIPRSPAVTPRDTEGLSREEERSFTHGEFWIPEAEREIYKDALRALNQAGIPYIISGAYAIYEYTGIYRETKDLDVFVEPRYLVPAMQALRPAGFTTRLEQIHWLSKATRGEYFVDLIFGMGNGLALIDEDWFRYSRPAILAAVPVRVAPVEELIWHRLFISERHRQDMADIMHLVHSLGHRLNWERLVEKSGEHWPLLLAQLQMFSYVYPEARDRIPPSVFDDLLERARADARRERSGERVTRGTLVSRFSFAIDVNEWGFRDLREELVHAVQKLPIIREIAASDVWDERSSSARRFVSRISAHE